MAQRANERFGAHRAGRIFVVQPPAIQGLGNSSGFSMYLVDQTGAGTEALRGAAEQLITLAEGDERVQNVDVNGTDDRSALRISIHAEVYITDARVIIDPVYF